MSHALHLLLLRHGQTDSNASGIVQGHLPVPLNELGHRQARALAARLATYEPRIGQVISSDLSRAAQTAEPIAQALRLSINFNPRWRERFLGEFQGKTIGERRTWTLASGEETPPGAESYEAFESRIRNALASLEEPAEGAPLAVVTHGGPCRMVLRLLACGALPIEGDRPEQPDVVHNCSIIRLHRSAEGTWRIGCVNDATHLERLHIDEPARDAG
jgi:probable phosphoglycerate mutase